MSVGAKRGSWIGTVVLTVLATLVVGGTVLAAIDGRRGYEVSNVRLVRAAMPADPDTVWRVTFDAEWTAFGDLPVQSQPCTVRLLAEDETILVERGFGLHVGRSDRNISPPFDFPVRSRAPDRADVVCSRRG